MKSDSIKEIASALCKAQKEMDYAKKDGRNPFFKSSYATLESIIEIFKEFFSPQGLAFTHLPKIEDGEPVIEVFLIHQSGEWLSGVYKITSVKQDPQGIGSAMTYARRYSLQSITGIVADDDDDAESAQGRGKEEGKKKPLEKKEEKSQKTKVDTCIDAFSVVLEKAVSQQWSAFLKKESGYNEKIKHELSNTERAEVAEHVGDLVYKISIATLRECGNLSYLINVWDRSYNDWFCRMSEVHIVNLKSYYEQQKKVLGEI